MRRAMAVLAGFACSLGLLWPGLAAADDRFTVLQRVYAPGSGLPPGGYDIWTGEVAGLWRKVLNHAAGDESILAMLRSPEAKQGLSFEVRDESGNEAYIAVTHEEMGDSFTTHFGMVLTGDGWKILDMWRTEPDGTRLYFSDFLAQLR